MTDLSQIPDLPRTGDEPVFEEPWEAQAFAMVVHLHAKGAFSWEEWAACLSAEIHSGTQKRYYEHWLAALEHITTQKALTTQDALQTRKQDWLAAAARTPHGAPITL